MVAAVEVMSQASSQSDSEREREGGEGEESEEAKEDGDSSKLVKTPAADEVCEWAHNEQTSYPLFVAGGERGDIFCEGKAVL